MATGTSKKSRKHDRNRSWCKAYRDSGKREINKARKLFRHLHAYPDDACAQAALGNIDKGYRKRAVAFSAEAASPRQESEA